GAFTDATGQTDYYLGDKVGLAVAGNGTAYAAWTDTRHGNQDVFATRFAVAPPPAASNDRFEPNNTPAAATDLGHVITTHVPRLAIAAGDQDWFRVKAVSAGTLTVDATLAAPQDGLRLELFDATGTTLLATGTAVQDGSGAVVGQTLTYADHTGQ